MRSRAEFAAHFLQNGGAEASMEWMLGHMDDADLNDAMPDPSAPSSATYVADPESVAMLTSMGFTDRQVGLCPLCLTRLSRRRSLCMLDCTRMSSRKL